MNVLAIIRKQEDLRTESEIRFCFNILVKSSLPITKIFKLEDFPDFNQRLTYLNELSKSRLFAWDWCPFRYKIEKILKMKANPRDLHENDIMRVGSNLHLIDQLFWERCPKDIFMQNIKNLNQDIYAIYFDLVLEELVKVYDVIFTNENINDYLNPDEFEYINAFCELETKRITAIFAEKGQTMKTINKYVYPFITEMAIENWDNHLIGIIDRGDILTNDAQALVEYKYGKPKYWDGSWKEAAIKKELAFYNLLVQGKLVYCVKQNDKGEDYCVLLKDELGFEPKFYYGSMIFFQDIENTGQLFKIKDSTMRAVQRMIDNYWYSLDKGIFPPKPNNSCYEWCPFFTGICEHNRCWKEIDWSVE